MFILLVALSLKSPTRGVSINYCCWNLVNKLKWQKNALTYSSKDDLHEPIRGHFISKLLVSLITSSKSFNLI